MLKFCKNKKGVRVLAIMLIIAMTFADIAFLGKSLVSYALDENLESQNPSTQHKNVEFDAYFITEEGDNVHSVVFDATKNMQKMNLYISVKKAGYLKEAYIDFRDEQNGIDTNYEIIGDTTDTKLVQTVNESTKTAVLNYINSGLDAVIEIPIKLNFTELMKIDKIKQDSLVTLRGIYVDEKGKETEISKTVKLNIGLNLETELNVEQAITKYVPYTNNEKTSLLVQSLVTVKQNRSDMAMPVKATEIKIKVPQIQQTLPEKIEVISNNTMATNGNKVEFTSENWIYDETENTITINTNGYNNEGTVWSGVGADEYFITYIYNIENYEDKATIHCDAQAKMDLYTAEGISSKTAESIGDIELDKQIGEIVTYSIEANSKELSKGRMYANTNTEIKTHETEYNTTIKANISNHEIVEQANMKLLADNFADEENSYTTQIGGISYTNYKQIIINKANMQKILGEEGYITINDSNSKQYIIDNETEDTDGNYIIDLEGQVGELTIQTSKPVEDGILQINAKKAISKDLPYTKYQLEQCKSLKTKLEGHAKYTNIDTDFTTNAEDTIKLLETSTVATLELSTTELSATQENKNVEMKISLNNNIEMSDLYKNPVFTISLPKYIEDIEITTGSVLYTTGLEIDYVKKDRTENGIILTIYTKGAETDFSNGVFTNGANLILNTNIKVNELAPNISDKITYTYTNENATSYPNNEECGKGELNVNFVAVEEMVTMNSILGNSINTATSVDDNEETAKLDILESEKTATMKLTIINKYSNICNKIAILGRVPFRGNKSITTGQDLGTTFDVEMIGEIQSQIQNAVIYYSDNGEATKDLNDVNNNWTTNRNSLQTVKSYLILLDEYEMQPGDKVEFTYDVQIPAGLEHNENAFGTYAMYFNSVSNYTTTNLIMAPKVGLTTGIGANMELTTTATYNGNELANNDTVKEYQVIKYKTVINNKGTVDAENVKLTSILTNGLHLDTSKGNVVAFQWNIDKIKAGESKTIEYNVQVLEGYDTDPKVVNKLRASADNFESELTETKENNIEKSKLKIDVTTQYPIGQSFTNGQEIDFAINAKNITDATINNVVIEATLPEGLEYTTTNTEGVSYDEKTRTISYKVDKLDAEQYASLMVSTKTKISNNVGKIDTIMFTKASVDNTDNYYAIPYEVTILGAILEAETSTSIANNSYIKEDNEVTFTIKVKNVGTINAQGVSLKYFLPNELDITKIVYKKQDKTNEMKLQKNHEYNFGTDIAVGEEIEVSVTAKASLKEEISEKTVKASIEVLDEYSTKIKSEDYTYTIEEKPEVVPGDNNDEVEVYRVRGLAWLDSNANGEMDDDEKKLEGIKVMLVDAKTGKVVQDLVNNTQKIENTSNNGTYTFTNIPKGTYFIVFEYDTKYYDITEYNKLGVPTDKSSKAISSKANIDGVSKLVGITNTIEITNSSVSNMNIGLVERPKFDLSLEKTISKITVQNKAGVKEYNFNNSELAKIDIPAKNMVGSTITIEYKITVKNEGEVAGYAKKIIDYMPKDTEFSLQQNSNWYKGNDGNLYSEILGNVLINPGESKELTLTLTKTMQSGDTSFISNTAEIYETYTEGNYGDIDSTPANNAQGEDDLDKADTIITVKTGQVALYITITLISISIIAGGIYLINKKVLRGGKI